MRVTINKTCATVSNPEMLTSGMVGKTIDAEFSADWLGLIKIAVFTNGAVTRDVIEPMGTVIIPWEVLATPNKRVSVGFYGYRMEGGEKVLAIPTIWAELGAVRAGADPSGDPSTTPTPEVAEQILGKIGDLDNLDTEAKDNLVNAINDAYNHGGGGSGTSDHRELNHRDAENQHPITAIEGLAEALDDKVDEVTGKGLSTNDFTDAYKAKLDGMNIVNVRDYGAEGDGSTDDTEAIIAAIAAVTTGGVLYFPSGTYRVSRIALKSDMTVMGDGWSSVIKLLDHADPTQTVTLNNCLNIVGRAANDAAGTPEVRAENITIQSIKLDGNRANNSSTGVAADNRLNGIFMQYADNITVRDVWLYNNGYHGTIFTHASNIVFDNCKSTDNGFRPIHGHTDIDNVRIADCYCDNNGLGNEGGSGNLYDAIYLFGVTGAVISGNTIKANCVACIAIDGKSSEGDATDGVSIVGNTCESYLDNGSIIMPEEKVDGVHPAYQGSRGIAIGMAYTHNVTVTGNTIRNAYEGIGIMDYASGCTVSGNTIEGCYYGIHISRVSKSLIIGNLIRSSSYQAIRLDGSNEISCIGNTVVEDAAGTVQTAAIQLTGSYDCTVDGNVIHAAAHYQYGFYVYSSGYHAAEGNVFANNRVEAVVINTDTNGGGLFKWGAGIESTNLKHLNVLNDAIIIGDLPTGGDTEVFTAVYGTTSFAEVTAAFTAGKKVQCKRVQTDTSYIYDLTVLSPTVARFGQFSSASLFYASVNSSNTWSEGRIDNADLVTETELSTALGSYRTSAAQNVIDATKADKPTIKSTMDAVAVANTQYFLGTQSAVSIVLPTNAAQGEQISVVWYNGATAATLSVTGTVLTVDYAPTANSRSEVNAMWDGTYWCVVTNEQAVTA